MTETKQYKLVYEKEGELKGSYSGIPANDDTDVIKRAVLEGKEDPVTPADPTTLYNKLVPLDFGEVSPTSIEKTYEITEIADIVWAIYEYGIETAFRLTYENKEYIVIAYENDETSSEERVKLINLVDIYADDSTAEEHNTFESITAEKDVETGGVVAFLIVK